MEKKTDNIKKKHLEVIKKIYGPSPLQMRWVMKIKSLLEGKGADIHFTDRTINIGGLYVRGVCLEDTHTQVRVEWFPERTISTNSNPFCSAFILSVRELRLLHKALKDTLTF